LGVRCTAETTFLGLGEEGATRFDVALVEVDGVALVEVDGGALVEVDDGALVDVDGVALIEVDGVLDEEDVALVEVDEKPFSARDSRSRRR